MERVVNPSSSTTETLTKGSKSESRGEKGEPTPLYMMKSDDNGDDYGTNVSTCM